MGERTDFSTNRLFKVGENWLSTCKRMKVDSHFIPYTKINSKWIKQQNLTAKSMKLEESLYDMAFCNRFVDTTLIAQTREEK